MPRPRPRPRLAAGALVPILLPLLAAAAPGPAGAGGPRPGRLAVCLEGGPVWTGLNDARIPGDGGTLISLDDELRSDTGVAWRARLDLAVGERSTLSALVAPLSIDVRGRVDREVVFAGAVFPAGSELGGEYRFDSYRLTYRYDDWLSDRWELGYGFTAKVRDAAISLGGAGLSAQKRNTGFVPLLHFRLRWRATDATSLLLTGDALAAPQGRAEDVLIALAHSPAPGFQLHLGYRLLEGGADNDEVYTFALLHYAVAGVTVWR